jgi:hypothetical protein
MDADRNIFNLTQIVAVGGQAVVPSDGTRFDLFGLWLAAAPIVVWVLLLDPMWPTGSASRR